MVIKKPIARVSKKPLRFPIKFKVFLRLAIGGRSYGERIPIFRKYYRECLRQNADEGSRLWGNDVAAVELSIIGADNACAKIHDEKVRNLSCSQIECDEIWGYIGAKKKNASRAKAYGDVWTFIGLDADSKLIPSFIVGKRDTYHARAFMADLSERMVKRIQVSTDALNAYPDAVDYAFGSEVDYGQIVKTYGLVNLNKEAASRYSPCEVVSVEKIVMAGMPDVTRITTSHVEKQNHTLRMHCRRLTRLTNAFSKKLENFQAAVSLNFAYYNFCKVHLAIRCTPAMQAGIEKSQWTVAELIERCGE